MILRPPSPGSEEKIQILMARASALMPLHQEGDAKVEPPDMRGEVRSPQVYTHVPDPGLKPVEE